MATAVSEMVRETAPADRLERWVALLAVVALAVPGLALLLGARPVDLENDEGASLPPVGLVALGDGETYAAVDRFLVDQLPGRDLALRSYAGVDYSLLRGTTTDQVIPGRADWLFFAGELRPRCPGDAAGLIEAIDRVGTRAAASGLDLRFIVAPDKHAIHPERVPPDLPIATPCTDIERPKLRAAFAERPDATVDLWAPVLAAAAASTEPLYFSQDSHWTPTGALAAIRALVDSLDPTVWDDGQVSVEGTSPFPMELARLMGLPRDATVPAYVVRPTVKVEQSAVPTAADLTNARDIARYRSSGPGRRVSGTTLVVYDSFFNINRTRIVPWFEDTVWVHLSDLRAAPALVADLPPIDRIVVERVERHVYELDLEGLLDPVLDQATRAGGG